MRPRVAGRSGSFRSPGRAGKNRPAIDADSATICRAVRAVSRRRLLRRIGAVEAETMADVESALATVLGLDLRYEAPTGAE